MALNFTKEGTYDETALIGGDWSEVYAEISGNPYRVGNVPNAQLEIGREFLEHVDTSFPRTVDQIIPTRVWMKFTGEVEEIHNQNVSWMMGQTLAPGSQNYLYVGDLQTPIYFTFFGKRVRFSDGVEIVFRMHKCIVRSVFSLSGGDEYAASPLELEALNDVDSDYGGSSTMPLGWIYAPDQGA